MKEIQNSKVENLKILFKCNNYYNANDNLQLFTDIQNIIVNQIVKLNFGSKINLNIKNLIIDVDYYIFISLFDNFDFPNLEQYELNLLFNKNIQNILYEINKKEENDFNSINYLLLKILNKNKFILKDIINLPNGLKKIKYLKINLKIFSFIYDGIKSKNNYIEFKLYDDKYYSSYDILIDEELSKYKKIKIEGLSKLKKQII